MKNQVIKVLNKEHGKKVIQFWKDRGVDTRDHEGIINESDGGTSIYYGVIGGMFSNYSLRQVQQYNAEIMIFFPKEEKNTPTECSICDLAESEKISILDENVDVKQEHILYDRSKEEEPIFKVGDEVYDIFLGWGVVTNTGNNHIEVKASNSFFTYIKDGRYTEQSLPTLSFTKYTLQGFSQERPIELPKVGEVCLFYDDDEDLEDGDLFCGKFQSYIPNEKRPYRANDNSSWSYFKRIKILD